ncbi:MAG: ABC transporter substrate-binding protein [Betaproteobacteria bacterium]|nr:ABC transporter substrate-binding protein [Betaproteobacteria bacterium]MDH5285339.1 ABC transporter substrate-binding protein [Betaproteobacteria bacterium]
MNERIHPTRRRVLQGLAGAAALNALPLRAQAGEPLKIGLILPMTGPFASTGKQVSAACRLYVQRNGDTVAGRKVDLIVKDDAGVPDTTKRIAQELVVQDKVHVLAGFGLTPLALATAPVATEAKVPMIVMVAATAIIPTRSPFIVRSGFTLPQVTGPVADWAAKNKIRRVYTMVTDYGPGLDAEKAFHARFKAAGGEIVESVRTPLANPDFGPFVQKVKDKAPDALFVFVPSGQGLAVMKQFEERGLRQAGIRMIGTGDVTDDDLLESMGPPAVGVITSFHYSAAHDSPENKAYVDAFGKANGGLRPNFHSVGGYDGMHLIYEAVKKTGGKGSGEELVNAMKGMSWTSPRGPVTIDPTARDVVQTVYLREVKMVGGKPWNVEFDKFDNVKPQEG